VIETLARFPREMVEEGFDALAADRSFSYRMRKKFAGAARPAADDDLIWGD